jgi:hypothetical protein
MREEYNNVLYYALHTDMLLGRLVIATMLLLGIVLTFLMALMLEPAIQDMEKTLLFPRLTFISSSHKITVFVCSLSILLACITTLAVTLIGFTNKYIGLFFKVKELHRYVESFPDDIRNLATERIVLSAARERALPGLGYLKSEWRKAQEAAQDNGGSDSDTSAPPAGGPSASNS